MPKACEKVWLKWVQRLGTWGLGQVFELEELSERLRRVSWSSKCSKAFIE